MLVWKVSGNIIKKHPVIGIGYGRFKSEYNLYQAEYFRGDHNKNEELLADNVRLAYNDYIEILVETGIIGLLIICTLIYYILKSLKLKKVNIYLSSIPLIICLILSLISYPLNSISTKILFIFFIGLLSAQISLNEHGLLRICIRRYSLIILLILLVPLAGYQVNRYSKFKQWLYADNAFSSQQTELSEIYYKQIFKNLKYDLRFALFYAECLFVNGNYFETISILNSVRNIVPDPEIYLLIGNAYYKTGNNTKAIYFWEEANYMVPSRVLPKYYLTKLYYSIGENSKADSLSRNILEMEVKVKTDTTQVLVNEIRKIYLRNYKQPDEYAKQGH